MTRFSLSGILDALRSRFRDRKAARELNEFERRARDASLSFSPHYYARAARLAAATGRQDRALELYGQAIDGYIEAGRSRAAEVLCRQVVTEFPHVVRARRTLALLAVARGDIEEAERLVHEYAEAARRNGDPEVLGASLRMMAAIGEAAPVLKQAAEELRAMGDMKGAARLLEHGAASDEERADQESERWSDAVQAALLGPSELKRGPRSK